MYFSAIVREKPIEIRYARGNTNIPLLLKTDIEDRINKIKSSDRLKIGNVHIGGIQVMIFFLKEKFSLHSQRIT